jgi:ABC-type bacteriocin/lantibiotic exporter with double-glycine peptidase domain
MDDAAYSCIKQLSPHDSAIAALATVACFHGARFPPWALREQTGLEQPDAEISDILIAAQRCGFKTVPIEGTDEELPEVPRPNLVLFKQPDGSTEFKVRFEIKADSVVIADLETGRIETLAKVSTGSAAAPKGQLVLAGPVPLRVRISGPQSAPQIELLELDRTVRELVRQRLRALLPRH